MIWSVLDSTMGRQHQLQHATTACALRCCNAPRSWTSQTDGCARKTWLTLNTPERRLALCSQLCVKVAGTSRPHAGSPILWSPCCVWRAPTACTATHADCARISTVPTAAGRIRVCTTRRAPAATSSTRVSTDRGVACALFEAAASTVFKACRRVGPPQHRPSTQDAENHVVSRI